MSFKLKQRLSLVFALLAILALLSLTVATIGGAVGNKKAQDSTNNVAVKDENSFTLRGKTISFLGDSITTYEGWSNNATYNSTLSNNDVKYDSSHFNVNSTWWKQTINELQLSLCVNNSCDASRVSETRTDDVPSAYERCTELDRDNGTRPDIIIVYVGTNDLGNGIELGDNTVEDYTQYFGCMYSRMLLEIVYAYSDADVFVCTLLPEYRSGCTDERLAAYNDAIRSIAASYGADVIDLYADSGITRANYAAYTLDKLHPNEEGMDLISATVVKALTEYYK